MYIYKLRINNFRNIENLVWKLNRGMNGIIGGNDSGKFSVAAVIDYLLNHNISWFRNSLSEIDCYNRNTDNNITIEAWFKDISIDDLELLFEYIDEDDNISENGEELILITRMTFDKLMKPIHSIISNGKVVHYSSIVQIEEN